MEIKELKTERLYRAGRELDALMAEKVMGWKWVRTKKSEWFTTGEGRDSGSANRMRQRLAWMISPEDFVDSDEMTLCEISDSSGKNIINTEYKPLHELGYGGYEFPDWGMPKHYSTSISDAWEVAQKLCENNRVDILANDGEQKATAPEGEDIVNEDGACQVSVINFDGGNEVWANAETAPLAICRAALKSVGK